MEVHSSGLAESVSTDLYALSRGFIPGGIVATSGVETRFDVSRGFIPGGIVALSGVEIRFIVGYRNPTYKSGIPIPPILVGVG
jgi:hypothetical protein